MRLKTVVFKNLDLKESWRNPYEPGALPRRHPATGDESRLAIIKVRPNKDQSSRPRVLFMSISIGIAKREINPEPGALLFGYALERRGHVVADDLFATALVLCSGDTTAAVVALDVALIDEDDTAAVQAAVEERTGIPARSVTVHASHTHSGPITVSAWGWGKKDAAYQAALRPKIADAVAEALEKLEPVKVGIGTGSTDASINRREVNVEGNVILGFNEWGPRDETVTVVRFEGESGTVATLLHVGLHPTSRGQQPDISRDWPGVAVDRLALVSGAPVIFINGCFGDVAPRTSVGGAAGDGGPAATEVGMRVANDAIGVWRAIKGFREEELQVLNAEFELPFMPLEPLEKAEAELEALGDQREAFGPPGAEWNFWNDVRERHQEGPRSGRAFRQTITAVGPIAIVPFAGEVFADIGLRLRKASPFAHTLVAGTTNGSHGYYVTRESRGRGGYEVWVARAYSAYVLAENIDDVLVRENLALLQQLAG